MRNKLLFIFFIFFILLLTSCSTYKIIEKQNFKNVKPTMGDNIKIVLKDGREIKAKDIIAYEDSINILSQTITNTKVHSIYRRKQLGNRKKSTYIKSEPLSFDNIEKIIYKNHLLGFLQGTFGGFAAGIGAGVLAHSIRSHPRESVDLIPFILFGSINLGSIICGIKYGYTKEYTFFDINDNLKYSKLRNKKTNFFKLGISSFYHDGINPKFAIGYSHIFSKNNIVYNINCLNLRFDGMKSAFIPYPIFNEIEFFRFGYRYYFTKNKKSSFYIGNNLSLGKIWFKNLSKKDIEDENFSFRIGASLGLNYIRNDKIYDIDFSVNFPLKSENSYFPTFQFSIGI